VLKVLFYGGCHAVALEGMFRAAATGWHRFDSLQNFVLINAGTPFPYERLRDFDAVVYSPVRNKDQWNTAHLVDRCKALRIETVSFPWLQWNGYFPDVMELSGQAPHIWSYRRFVELAAQGWTDAQLLADARSREAFNPLPYRDWSFSTLEEHEAEVDLPISGFIRDNFQARRLLWTPNHPTLALYRFVMAGIAERLGLKLKPGVKFDEPHKDSLIILPGVAEALGLQFPTGDYRPEVWPQGIGLEAFVALNQKIYGAVPAN
jgi:hypothetical protein